MTNSYVFPLFCLGVIASNAYASNILFQNEVLTDEANPPVISNVGTLIEAYNYGGETATLNGVNFIGVNDSVGQLLFDTSSFALSPPITVQNYANAANPDLFEILNNFLFDGVLGELNTDFTLTGLTPGSVYQFQLIFGDNRVDVTPPQNERLMRFNIGEPNQHDSIIFDTFSIVTGTFIAEGTGEQSFTMELVNTGSGELVGTTQILAYQLRIIPEPSTYAVLVGALALAVAAFMQRLRR
ncbi:MAG: PEP-CTERM sorting domain-containing protein [Opitutales bacterium]